MAGNIRFSSDDHVVLVNGIPVGHFTRGRIQADTASKITPIETAEGVVGSNVGPIARSRPGSGSFSLRITSPDLYRLAVASANADDVSVLIRVIKNFGAFSYKEVGLTNAILGPVPIGPDSEAPELEVSFSGTGYFITAKDQ